MSFDNPNYKSQKYSLEEGLIYYKIKSTITRRGGRGGVLEENIIPHAGDPLLFFWKNTDKWYLILISTEDYRYDMINRIYNDRGAFLPGREGNKVLKYSDDKEFSSFIEWWFRNISLNPNLILYGPPGTGKTFSAVSLAISHLGKSVFALSKPFQTLFKKIQNRDTSKRYFDKNDLKASVTRNNHLVSITFHQSYSYEDFVEGIKPTIVDTNVSYKVKDGLFKRLCYAAYIEYFKITHHNGHMLQLDRLFDIDETEYVKIKEAVKVKLNPTNDKVNVNDEFSKYIITCASENATRIEKANSKKEYKVIPWPSNNSLCN